MYNEERELFKKALLEATYNAHSAELARCGEDAGCSTRHRRRMREIIQTGAIRGKGKRRIGKRSLIALVAAAVLLLASCAAFIYRERLCDFLVEVYESYLRVSSDEDEAQVDAEEITEF